MKLFKLALKIAFILAPSSAFSSTTTFSPASKSSSLQLLRADKLSRHSDRCCPEHSFCFKDKPTTTALLSKPTSSFDEENSNFIEKWGLGFDPVFGTLWFGILVFAVALAPGTFNGPEDTELLNQFIANPANSGLNEIFLIIFNLFAVIPFVLAGVILPGTANKKNGISPTPFVAASSAVGFFALGPYLTIRGDISAEPIFKRELGWFTRNVLENKAVNFSVLLLSVLVPLTSGILAPGFNMEQSFQEFLALISSSKFVSVSSVDLSLLSLSAAILIPDDLKRRGFEDETKAKAIAAASLILPVIGGAVYCALRPEMEE